MVEVAPDAALPSRLGLWVDAKPDCPVLLLRRGELNVAVLLSEALVAQLAGLKAWQRVLSVESWVESLHPSVVQVDATSSNLLRDLNAGGDRASEGGGIDPDAIKLAALELLDALDLSLHKLASLAGLLVTKRREDGVHVTLVLLFELSIHSLVGTLTVADHEAVTSRLLLLLNIETLHVCVKFFVRYLLAVM